ncbi:MAG: SagB/ThcOx family dehydrogenase [Verrucomicrobia bacterium]|nr:SagB/ThcOx family dehydrogenase [Verrucomicrobiota bacterium]MBU1735512.1 SagB/ThcOx family dehydrogenase [Verrucomicrobiota bacterium]MBU1856907.1 SagB/ThcOx family dehydrogenase [Verrucomicrobiota bacterium]
MQKVPRLVTWVVFVVIGWGLLAGAAEPLKPVVLPAPQMDKGRPLMQVLKDRQSRRDISPDKKLSLQELSNLLWAACGVNRPDSGKRTAPTASNRQEIDVYLATAEGMFLYDVKGHKLEPVLQEDVRKAAGKQAFVQTAPVVLIFVVDEARMGRRSESDKVFYAATDTGFVSQNVYLYCASEGLATVVIGMVDKPALAAKMKLRPEQKVVLTQPVGYPAK